MKILLIYNPAAGNGSFKNSLDWIIKTVQEKGSYLIPYRTSTVKALQKMFHSIDLNSIDRIWIAGGDGTIHEVINALYKVEGDIPVGIFPVGTANDFAYYFQFPAEINKMVNLLLQDKFTYCDIGIANNHYFLNVASMGSLVDVSQKTDKKFKNILGLLAYYLKGAEELTHLKPVQVSISCQEKNFEDEIFFMLIMNGKSAGGFRKIAPYASLTDGLLDVYIFKKSPIYELLPLFIKIANGEHTASRYVDYFQTAEMTIKCAETVGTDMDGEKGFDYPLKVSVKPRKLKLITG
ncbi:MAG: YegS/Rv2252/BmrU family lipid kinase [Peptococcaceae bacterium]|nr:YegS/Rv2252/BmrU family lipid kinase [Peptococcaceae bacterium]